MRIARVSAVLAAVALLGLPRPGSATFLAESYFPLARGNFWHYNGSPPSTDGVVGPIPIGGVLTLVLCRCEGIFGALVGTMDNLTNDSNGLRLHGFADSDPSSPFGATLSPPSLLLEADFEVGVPMNSQGDLAIASGDTVSYTTTATATGPVAVTVPFGTFDAILLEITLNADGFNETDRVWLVANIGPVKWVLDVFGEPETRELVSTNVPEPSTGLLVIAGLLGLAAPPTCWPGARAASRVFTKNPAETD